MENIFNSTTCSEEVPEFNMELFERAKKNIKKMARCRLLVGLVVNKKTHKWLLDNSTEKYVFDNLLSVWCIVPFDGVSVFVKKYQRGYRAFYDKDTLQRYLQGI